MVILVTAYLTDEEKKRLLFLPSYSHESIINVREKGWQNRLKKILKSASDQPHKIFLANGTEFFPFLKEILKDWQDRGEISSGKIFLLDPDLVVIGRGSIPRNSKIRFVQKLSASQYLLSTSRSSSKENFLSELSTLINTFSPYTPFYIAPSLKESFRNLFPDRILYEDFLSQWERWEDLLKEKAGNITGFYRKGMFPETRYLQMLIKKNIFSLVPSDEQTSREAKIKGKTKESIFREHVEKIIRDWPLVVIEKIVVDLLRGKVKTFNDLLSHFREYPLPREVEEILRLMILKYPWIPNTKDEGKEIKYFLNLVQSTGFYEEALNNLLHWGKVSLADQIIPLGDRKIFENKAFVDSLINTALESDNKASLKWLEDHQLINKNFLLDEFLSLIQKNELNKAVDLDDRFKIFSDNTILSDLDAGGKNISELLEYVKEIGNIRDYRFQKKEELIRSVLQKYRQDSKGDLKEIPKSSESVLPLVSIITEPIFHIIPKEALSDHKEDPFLNEMYTRAKTFDQYIVALGSLSGNWNIVQFLLDFVGRKDTFYPLAFANSLEYPDIFETFLNRKYTQEEKSKVMEEILFNFFSHIIEYKNVETFEQSLKSLDEEGFMFPPSLLKNVLEDVNLNPKKGYKKIPERFSILLEEYYNI